VMSTLHNDAHVSTTSKTADLQVILHVL